ncbi:MAG: gluconokinase [Anaerolineae bacterium]|nr:gluconokinase [Anaerolineae bacterium]
MQSVIVLDLGSSSTRAILYDAQANPVPGAMVRETFDFHVDQHGASEDDPALALARANRCLAALKASAAYRAQVQTEPLVAISSYAGSLLCLDNAGQPLTPIYTYADTRASSDAAQLRETFDEIEVLQRTGCRIRANYTPSRLAWLKRTQPDIFARTRHFATLSDYVRLKLFGQLRCGISIASWSGLLNRQHSDWDLTWLQLLGVDAAQLPAIDNDTPNHAPLIALGDGAGANIGSGCTDPSRVAVTIGTTGAMRIVSPHNAEHPVLPALWAYRASHALDLIGGATTEGGNVVAWLRSVLAGWDNAEAEAAIAAQKPDGHGLTVLPMFGGERSPGFADRARATLHGLSFDTSPADIARACYEAIAYRLGSIYAALTHNGDMSKHSQGIIASGGALLASPTWCQIIADVTGTPVQLCEEPEATARGAAMLALQRLDVPARLGRSFEPNVQHAAIYRAAAARQQTLYNKLVG